MKLAALPRKTQSFLCVEKKRTRGGQVVWTLCGRQVLNTWESFLGSKETNPLICPRCSKKRKR